MGDKANCRRHLSLIFFFRFDLIEEISVRTIFLLALGRQDATPSTNDPLPFPAHGPGPMNPAKNLTVKFKIEIFSD